MFNTFTPKFWSMFNGGTSMLIPDSSPDPLFVNFYMPGSHFAERKRRGPNGDGIIICVGPSP